MWHLVRGVTFSLGVSAAISSWTVSTLVACAIWWAKRQVTASLAVRVLGGGGLEQSLWQGSKEGRIRW